MDRVSTETLATCRTQIDEEMKRRAVEIADEAMYELLLSSAIHIGEDPAGTCASISLALVDEHGSEVVLLEAASPAILESYSWLQKRGAAEINSDAEGQFITLRGPPPFPQA
ncbi:MAG: hypothetical protein E6Q76_08195 [Rhizobium sp.]|nr:MAG: hypothetical protein E6Q76_08195 [Rhizobium sp.]